MAKLSEAAQKKLNNDLMGAALWGNKKGVLDLLAQGAEINAKNKRGETALMVAVMFGSTYWVENPAGVITAQALIAAGADVNAQDNKGWTALMVAAIYGRTELGLALVEAGADVNVQNNEGDTAVTLAVKGENFNFAKMLHEHGVDMSSVEDFILALEAKEQTRIQEAFQEAITNLGATDLGQLVAAYRKAQTQTNEPETVFHHVASLSLTARCFN